MKLGRFGLWGFSRDLLRPPALRGLLALVDVILILELGGGVALLTAFLLVSLSTLVFIGYCVS